MDGRQHRPPLSRNGSIRRSTSPRREYSEEWTQPNHQRQLLLSRTNRLVRRPDPVVVLAGRRTVGSQVVLTKIMTSKKKTNAFAVIQGILSESGPAGFYTGIQVRAFDLSGTLLFDVWL